MADNVTLMSENKDFDQTPSGWAKRWKNEVDAAKKALEKWQRTGDEIIRVFKAEAGKDNPNQLPSRVPLYTGNVQTQRAMLYGEEPQAKVDRRFADAKDEDARVAGEMLERLLNDDLSNPCDTFQPVLGYALDDFQLPGIGVMRWRYEAEFEDTEAVPAILHPETGEELAPAVEAGEQKSSEKVKADYIHWRDFIWSPARTWLEVRWVGFAAYLTKDEVRKKFGEQVAKKISFTRGVGRHDTQRQEDALKDDPWARALVWELWSREFRKCFWWCDGVPETLRIIEDPLQLENFFPMPEPLLANLTTSTLVPRPDYALAQDMYQEFDEVTYRARMVAKAIKVRGVYDGKNKQVGRILQEAFDQDLIPVDNWGAFEKGGGLPGALQLLPIDMLAGVLEQLLSYRMQLKQLLDEVTGNGDIMRGAAASVGEEQTATETRSQVRFGSVRLKAKQKRFEKFASEALQVKAEIISKHYSPETILKCSNFDQTFDAQRAESALALLKDQFWYYRIAVKPNSVSMRDMAEVKSERVQLLESLSTFLSGFGPVIAQQPALAPMCLQLLRATLAGFEASEELEGIIEEGITAWQQAQEAAAQQGAPPDPKLLAAQAKAQADIQKEQVKAQADQQQTMLEVQARREEVQAELQADIARQAAQAHFNLMEEQGKANLNHQHQTERDQLQSHYRQQEQASRPRPNPNRGKNGK